MPITRPTVLILGAGASRSYGLPVGVELRDIVCRMLQQGVVDERLADLGHKPERIAAFLEGLRFSGLRSVDVFLELNPEFLDIGKQCIAAALLPKEAPKQLFPPDAPEGQHWYEFLANRMGLGTSGWEANRLGVITFNYDRSLEHYFTRIIAQRTGVAPGAALGLLRHVPIVHVHGVLGPYAVDGTPGLQYGAEPTAANIASAAKGILVVSEATDSLPTFDLAFDLLSGAERVYFLGFGYQDDNVRRLKAFEALPTGSGRVWKVSGTMAGLSRRDYDHVTTTLLHGNWHGTAYPGTAMQFLYNEAVLD